MIDWIDERCKAWGRAVRKSIADPKPGGHELGWPAMSILGKIKDEWEGAVYRFTGNRTQPVWSGNFTGPALEIHRAIFHPKPMPFELYAALKVHYCVIARAKNKAPMLQRILGMPISVREYWEWIDRAHHFLLGRITGTTFASEPEKSVRTK